MNSAVRDGCLRDRRDGVVLQPDPLRDLLRQRGSD
jgi:hypothetical protein